MKTVLVVDDDTFCRQNLVSFLEDSGFAVLGEGKNGKEAYKQYCELHPDLVIMDLRMPVYSSYDGLRWIMEYDHNAKVIMMSGDASAMDRDTAWGLGSCHFLGKPIDLEQLIVQLSQIR